MIRLKFNFRNQSIANLLVSGMIGWVLAGPALGAPPRSFVETVHHHVLRSSTISENEDTNPYAVLVAPVSAGVIHQGDVLIDNFNNISNLQGTGTTIVDYNPTTRKLTQFARISAHLPQCPGGVGLTAAMTMLKTGWIIVGSTPSTDGTTRTKGNGALLVFDATGQLAAVWIGPNIDGPWGNIATIDRGTTATIFVSMAGFNVPGHRFEIQRRVTRSR